jgi:hypothetical protein
MIIASPIIAPKIPSIGKALKIGLAAVEKATQTTKPPTRLKIPAATDRINAAVGFTDGIGLPILYLSLLAILSFVFEWLNLSRQPFFQFDKISG